MFRLAFLGLMFFWTQSIIFPIACLSWIFDLDTKSFLFLHNVRTLDDQHDIAWPLDVLFLVYCF